MNKENGIKSEELIAIHYQIKPTDRVVEKIERTESRTV